MPFKVKKDVNRCSISKPWAVISEGSGNTLGCHETKSKAERQLRAVEETYSNSEGDMKKFHFGSDLNGVQLDDQNRSWVHAMAPGEYKHPIYGTLEFSVDRLMRFANNIVNKVRGVDPDVDYDHKKEDGRAAGWVRDATVKADGLWLLVEWTKNAAQAIKDREYRYFSPEFTFSWEHPETGAEYEDVVVGGALTNRPFLKNLVPINLSELDIEDEQEEGMDPKLREALIKRFGLSEDVSDEQIMEAAQTEASKVDLSSATVEVSDDGTIVVKHPEADGEVTYKPDDSEQEPKDSELAKLAEDHPAVKQLMERVGTLETTTKLSDVTMKLNELNSVNPKVALPPAVVDKFRSIMVKSPVKLSDEIYTALTDLVKTGMVSLGEEGGGETDLDVDGDEVKLFTEAVEEKRKEHEGIQFGDAVNLVIAEQPDLYRAYSKALEDAAK